MLEELLQRIMGAPPTTVRERDELEREPDAVLSLRVKFRDERSGEDMLTPEVQAEVRSRPTFGFNPRRERLEVRLRLPADSPVLPPTGITLVERDAEFGPVNGWKCRAVMLPNADGTADYLLED